MPVWVYSKFLRFSQKTVFYQHRVMVFGLCVAPSIFTIIIRPVIHLFRSLTEKKKKMFSYFIYLDNILMRKQALPSLCVSHRTSVLLCWWFCGTFNTQRKTSSNFFRKNVLNTSYKYSECDILNVPSAREYLCTACNQTIYPFYKQFFSIRNLPENQKLQKNWFFLRQ